MNKVGRDIHDSQNAAVACAPPNSQEGEAGLPTSSVRTVLREKTSVPPEFSLFLEGVEKK